MKTIEVIPGLHVDEEMFEAAASAAQKHGGLVLTWDAFASPGGWMVVPDDCGDGYKAEFVLHRAYDRTVKVNLWFLPDLRGGQVSRPHNHPWGFDAHVLLGGYSENRYELDGDTVHAARGVEHHSGDINRVPLAVYHEVTEIHNPGRTLTLMVCGPGERGNWGYLDTLTGEHRADEPDPGFRDRLRMLNPHR